MFNAVLRSVGEHGAVSSPPAQLPPSTQRSPRLPGRRRERRRSTWARWLVPALAIVLTAVAIVLLQHELRHYNYRVIARAVSAIPTRHILIAVLATAASYSVLFWY